MLVSDEGYNVFHSKGVEKKVYRFKVVDVSNDSGQRCTNNFFFVPTDEQKDKFKGKLRDQRVIISFHSCRPSPFSGDIEVNGDIEQLKKSA